MPRLQFLFLISFLSLAVNTVCAKEIEKKIRFHPPETEAERALDVILRIDNFLLPTCKQGESNAIYCPKCKIDSKYNTINNMFCEDWNHENKTTKAFRADEDRQQREYEEKNPCIPGDMCLFHDAYILTDAQDMLTEVGFLYYTKEYKGDSIRSYIYMMPLEFAIQFGVKDEHNNSATAGYSFNNHDNFNIDLIHNYSMKKEDGKWKVDGVCFYSFTVNHHCCSSYYKTLFW